MSSNTLAEKYIIELLALALNKRTVMDTVLKYMKFSWFQTEEQKHLWKYIKSTVAKTGLVPTIGKLQQQFSDRDKVLHLIAEIDNVEISDGELGLINEQEIIHQFEEFVKKMKFLEANDRITEEYNKGKKQEAWDLFVQYANDFANFSIADAKFETVFGDFAVRQMNRRSEDYHKRFKIATGIDALDWLLGGASGGPETGEFVLFLGDSGIGKSQLLVHCGIASARQGHRVAHFQLEGTKEQCLNRYDAAWTGTLYSDVKVGNIPQKKMEVTKKIIKKLNRSDIIVSSEETFNAKTLVDVRRELKEMERKYGKIDVVVIDYLELLEVGDGHNYTPSEERFRQAKIAKGLKMIAMEFNVVVYTATQSSNIPEECKNDPEFVITRAHLNEDKGKCRPADIFVTLNQTRDERKNETMRLFTEKLRDYKCGDVIVIANNFSRSRFYDRKRTIEMNMED